MARIDKALHAQLTGNAGVQALLGTEPVRVWVLKLPDDPDLPALTYQQVSGMRESALASDVGLAHGTWQFDAWATKYTVARDVADAMLAVMQRATFTAESVDVLDAIVESERMLYEEAARLYRVSVDLTVWWRE